MGSMEFQSPSAELLLLLRAFLQIQQFMQAVLSCWFLHYLVLVTWARLCHVMVLTLYPPSLGSSLLVSDKEVLTTSTDVIESNC